MPSLDREGLSTEFYLLSTGHHERDATLQMEELVLSEGQYYCCKNAVTASLEQENN